MDGTSAQIPIVMGSITDENPSGGYGVEGGREEGFAQLTTPTYSVRDQVKTVVLLQTLVVQYRKMKKLV